MRFRVPAGLPPSEAPTSRYHLWRLKVKGSMPGVDLDRTYAIAMRPGTTTSAGLSALPLTGENTSAGKLGRIFQPEDQRVAP